MSLTAAAGAAAGSAAGGVASGLATGLVGRAMAPPPEPPSAMDATHRAHLAGLELDRQRRLSAEPAWGVLAVVGLAGLAIGYALHDEHQATRRRRRRDRDRDGDRVRDRVRGQGPPDSS